MKKTGIFSALAFALALTLLAGARTALSPDQVSAAETDAPSASSTADPTTPETTPSATSGGPSSTDAPETTGTATDAPTVSVTPPVTDAPIVQPEPEPIENSVFLTHSTPLRAGSEVTFIFSCSGADVRALQGSISFDNTLLTYKSASTLDSSWLFTLADEGEGKLSYVGLSTEVEGASGISQLFSLTFTLSADAVTGNAIPFHVADATALKGDNELTFSGDTCNFLVDRAVADEATLSDLKVGAGTLVPEFDPTVTEYRLQVPFEVEKLEIAAAPCAYAALEISDSTLAVGNNTITLTVTAESGKQQLYTLTVTRQSDPNYHPSADSALRAVDLSDGILFPAFSPAITEYTVYLINDGAITLTPTASELGSAEAVTLESNEGATCALTAYAEDGSSTVYRFTVVRLQVSGGSTGGTVVIGAEQSSTTLPLRAEYLIAIAVAAAVTLFFVGFGVSSLLRGRKKSSDTQPIEDERDVPSEETEKTEVTEEVKESEASSEEPKDPS